MYFICFTWNIAYFEVNIEIYYIYFKDNYIYTVNNVEAKQKTKTMSITSWNICGTGKPIKILR